MALATIGLSSGRFTSASMMLATVRTCSGVMPMAPARFTRSSLAAIVELRGHRLEDRQSVRLVGHFIAVREQETLGVVVRVRRQPQLRRVLQHRVELVL